MSNYLKLTLLVVILAVSIGVAYVSMYVTYNNQYTELVNMMNAQHNVNKVVYDEMHKVITKDANVASKYSEDFKDNYVAIMKSRNYGGEMMKWIQERNPNFTSEMYQKIQDVIEAKHAEFTMNEKKSISIQNQIKNLVQKIPSKMFLGGKDIPELKLVTSTKTEKSFETGIDDDTSVF